MHFFAFRQRVSDVLVGLAVYKDQVLKLSISASPAAVASPQQRTDLRNVVMLPRV